MDETEDDGAHARAGGGTEHDGDEDRGARAGELADVAASSAMWEGPGGPLAGLAVGLAAAAGLLLWGRVRRRR